MDMDCMVLEDVELEPEPSVIRYGRTGEPEELHVAPRAKDDCLQAHFACLRFQTTSRTRAPNAVWPHTSAHTAVESATSETCGQHSLIGGTLSACGERSTSAAGAKTNAGRNVCSLAPADRKLSVSVPSIEPPPERGKSGPAGMHAVQRGRVWSSSSPFLERDHVLGFLTFLLCGVASLSCWQFLLSLMAYIEQVFFEKSSIGNSLLGVYQVGCICVQLMFMFLVESMHPWMVIAATVVDAALALVFPIVVSYGSRTTRMVLTHVVALFFGVCAGIICGCSLSVASALPYNFIGAFSIGQGVVGILSFCIGLAFKEVFDVGTSTGLSSMLWLEFGISSGSSLLSACLLLLVLRQPWAARQLAHYWEAQRLRSSTRRWTTMWRRWVGQPQKACLWHEGSTVRPAPGHNAPVADSNEKEGPCAVAQSKSSENSRDAVQSFAANKLQVVDNDSNLPSSRVVTATSPSSSCENNIVPAQTLVKIARQQRCSTQVEQLPQWSDCESLVVTSSSTIERTLSAPRDMKDRKTRDVPSVDPELRLASSILEGPVETRTPTGRGKALLKKNSLEGQGAAVRVSFSSGDATCCEKPFARMDEVKYRPSRGWRHMLRDSGTYLVCVYLNFFITLNIYPRVGPIMWHYPSFAKSGSQYIILFGVFCMGDFFGKCILDISKTTKKLSWIMVPQKLLLPFVVSRLGIAVFALLGAYVVSHWFFSNFAFYVITMLLLAITSGWCATTSLLYVCTSVERLEEREILGPASVLMLQLGIMTGVWSALAYPMP